MDPGGENNESIATKKSKTVMTFFVWNIDVLSVVLFSSYYSKVLLFKSKSMELV